MSFIIVLYPGARIRLLDHFKSFSEYLISLMCAPFLKVCPTVFIPECVKCIWPFKKCTSLSGSDLLNGPDCAVQLP